MGRPYIGRLEPSAGSRGTSLAVRIIGDGMTGVLRCEMGDGITVQSLRVLGDGGARIEIDISADAEPGKRDVTLAKEKPHETDTLKGGFEVI